MGELAGLKWEDIGFERKTMTIPLTGGAVRILKVQKEKDP